MSRQITPEHQSGETGYLILASDEVSAALPLTSAALPLVFWEVRDRNINLLHVWVVLVPLPLVWMWRRRLLGTTPDSVVADVKRQQHVLIPLPVITQQLHRRKPVSIKNTS